jgi:hypothetical protein
MKIDFGLGANSITLILAEKSARHVHAVARRATLRRPARKGHSTPPRRPGIRHSDVIRHASQARLNQPATLSRLQDMAPASDPASADRSSFSQGWTIRGKAGVPPYLRDASTRSDRTPHARGELEGFSTLRRRTSCWTPERGSEAERPQAPDAENGPMRCAATVSWCLVVSRKPLPVPNH